MQWRKKQRWLYVIGSANHALLIKQYRDDGDCLYSTNEDDGEGEAEGDGEGRPLGAPNGTGTYARAAQHAGQRPRPAKGRPGHQPFGRPHRSPPLVTAEKKTFNEEEYTKITTPRQDVLFKKGYLGRKKATAAADSGTLNATAPAPAAPAAAPAAAAAAAAAEPPAHLHNGGEWLHGEFEQADGDGEDALSPADEHAQFVYTNGYVDGVIYVNGGYEWYDPYGNVAVVVGPAPFAAPAGASVLAALPCQPLPLQPIEWFNPAPFGVPFAPLGAAAPCTPPSPPTPPTPPPCAPRAERRKRAAPDPDSQNCSPQSSESTDPPGSPQEGVVEVEGEGDGEGDGEVPAGLLPALAPALNGGEEYALYPHPAQPPAYMYPGAYMFGQPLYSMNGISVQSTPQLPQNTDISGSKRRKKKRRRRRRRGGVEDGSEETSSDEKDLEEPISLTSQESSQEVESDSKNSAGSASCPTIVGCPELPERTRPSPSSSPSLSPSLSPSPSPPNVTEDKTALLKQNYINVEGKTDTRSEDISKIAEIVETQHISLEGVDNNVSLIPNSEKANSIHSVNEPCLEYLNIIQNGESNGDPLYVIDASTVNGTPLLEKDKSSILDNNLPTQDCITFSAQEQSQLVVNTGLKECAKKNFSLLKQKSKGKKGAKLNKQKTSVPVQNGFSQEQINDHPESPEALCKMDGNESEIKNESFQSKNCPQSSEKQEELSKQETEGPVRCSTFSEEDTNKSKSESSVHDLPSREAPKKPTRIHLHQQQNVQQPQSSSPQEQDENLKFSLDFDDNVHTKDITNLSTTLPLSGEKKEVRVTKYETKSSQGKDVEFSTSESKKVTLDADKSNLQESARPLLMQSKLFSGTNKYQGGLVPTKEPGNLCANLASNSKPGFSKTPCKTSILGVSNTSKADSCDTTENKSSSGQPLSESVPSTPPIPPPRRKKWLPNKKISAERPPTPGRELEAKKPGEIADDSSSSSSHESEESVIDLLTSSPTDKTMDSKVIHDNGYVKPENSLIRTSAISPEFKQSNVTDQSETSSKIMLQELKCSDELGEESRRSKAHIKASEPFESTKCISKQSKQDLNGDQTQQKISKFEVGSKEVLPPNTGNGVETDGTAKAYADDLACQVLDEGLSNAAVSINKTSQALSLTEAVTQWLHSQDSADVLQVPHLFETESDIEDIEEASEPEIHLTGPKNVHRNPLLAPSCKTKNTHDDAGRRVANLQNKFNINTENDEESVCKTDSSLNSEITKKEGQYLSEQLQESKKGKDYKMKLIAENSGVQNVQERENKEVNKVSPEEIYHSNVKQNAQMIKSEEWDCFTNESEEYDADWECDPVIPKSATLNLAIDDEESHLSLDFSEDKCFFMCDPTLSVAKYYRLGPPAEKYVNKRDLNCDIDSGREECDDEDDYKNNKGDGNDSGDDFDGMDALIHFRNELKDHTCTNEELKVDHSKRYQVHCNCLKTANIAEMKEKSDIHHCGKSYNSLHDGCTSDSGIQSEESCNEDGSGRGNNSSKSASEINKILKRKSAIILSHLGADGPFPCGGICCILQ